MLDAERPRGRDAAEKQNKHDNFGLSMNIHAAAPMDLSEILALLKSTDLPVAGIEQHVAATSTCSQRPPEISSHVLASCRFHAIRWIRRWDNPKSSASRARRARSPSAPI